MWSSEEQQQKVVIKVPKTNVWVWSLCHCTFSPWVESPFHLWLSHLFTWVTLYGATVSPLGGSTIRAENIQRYAFPVAPPISRACHRSPKILLLQQIMKYNSGRDCGKLLIARHNNQLYCININKPRNPY